MLSVGLKNYLNEAKGNVHVHTLEPGVSDWFTCNFLVLGKSFRAVSGRFLR